MTDRRLRSGLASAVFAAFLALLALAVPQSSPAQARQYKIGIITYAGEAPADPGGGDMPIKRRLADLGYVEGKNVTYRFMAAGRDDTRMTARAQEMVAWKPDLIISLMSNADLAVMHATSTIPVVFWATDPLEEELIKSYRRPGKNFTGFSFAPGFALLQMRVVKILLPNAKRVAHLYNRNYSPAPSMRREIEEAGRWMGIEVKTYETFTKEEFEPAFAKMKADGMEAITVGPHALFNTNGATLGPLAQKYKLPIVACCQSSITSNGGVANFGPPDGWPLMAERIDLILQGKATPAETPILRMRGPMTISLKSLKALGMTAPDSLIDEADTVMQ